MSKQIETGSKKVRGMARQRLANRRAAETFQLEAGGLRYTCTVGRFPDGSIGELFLAITSPTAPPIPTHAIRPSSFRSPSNTAPIPKRSGVLCAAIAKAVPRDRLRPPSTCSRSASHEHFRARPRCRAARPGRGDDATDVLENWACASTLQDIGFDFAHQPSHSASGFNGLAAVETYDQLRNNLVDVLGTIRRAADVLAELRGGSA
jgi:hypothetical protein